MEERNRFKEKEWNLHRIALDYSKLASKVTGVAGTANAIRFQEIDRQYSLSSETYEREELIRQLFELETTNPFLEFRKGWLAGEVMKDISQAEMFFSKAITLKPDFITALENLGLALQLLGKYEESIQSFDRLILLGSIGPVSYNGKAFSLYKLGKLGEALVFANKAIDSNDQSSIEFGTLAEIHSALGNNDQFYESLEKALSLDPSEVDHLDPSTIARHENEPRFQELLKKYKKS
jgi:tetratricopeptide (TPR) repeat protein